MRVRAALLAGMILGCESGYDAAPTVCDDWCRATQRADCAEDWPHECVAACTYLGYEPTASLGCDIPWRELMACYQREPDDAFFCRNDVSQPRIGVCAAEQSRLGRCLNPVWQSCIEACFGLALSCEEFDSDACSRWCTALPSSCLDAVAYHDCLLANLERCDVLAPECAESRALAVRCPAQLVSDAGAEP